MSHIPFMGKRGIRYGLSPRMAVWGLFESHGYNPEQQEKYYRFWYDWAKNYVENDPDLSVTKGTGFKDYPYGQHAHHEFHLNDKVWASALADLGDLIRDTIWPKLSEEQAKKVEQQHDELIKQLDKEAQDDPRKPTPEIGYFRHV